MSDILSLAPDLPGVSAAEPVCGARPLSAARKGERGVIIRVGGDTGHAEAIDPVELERRLLEMGFVEGARIEILHEGLFGRDPIAVRIDDMRVALRRREAGAVTVQFEEI